MKKLIRLLKKMRKNNIEIVFSLFFMFYFVCCIKKNECSIEYMDTFYSAKKPIIYITGIDKSVADSCIYNININIWFSDNSLSSDGKLYKEEEAFYLKSITPRTRYIKYFDFSKSLGEGYDIELIINDKKYQIDALIERIVKTKNYGIVHLFRFKNTYYYLDKAYDTVVLASLTKGILGSYFSVYDNNVQYMFSPAGELLEKQIDYSTLELRELK